MSKKMQSNMLLLLTALVWGASFVAQKTGGVLGAFTYNGIRTFLGGLVLIPVVLFLIKKDKAAGLYDGKTDEELKAQNRMDLIGGVCCGLALFAASMLQQYGINFTTAGKAGFITSLYAVLVPILSILIGKKVRPIIWFCVVLGAFGLYMLTMFGQSMRLQTGDFFVLLCAFAFAVHIMVIDHFSPKCNGPKISCIQFLVAGGLAIIGMFIWENPNLHDILYAWLPIVYGGVGSCAIGYTLQIVAQKNADPAEASLILCLESVFSAIFGAILLSERMSIHELIGCAMIFTAVVISQLPSKEERLAQKAEMAQRELEQNKKQ
ncbi:MAG: DMT family transporter [Anaerovoracaceae bacterium]|jgi:drug/metabolite transporter (DMT)-like permease